MTTTRNELDAFTMSYAETALWSSTIDSEVAEQNDCAPDTSMESFGLAIEDIAPDALRAMVADCADFQGSNAGDLETADVYGRDASHAGHDFWLTRNRHGAGFWDGDYPEPIASRLTDAARAYGDVDLYIGDDGRIYSS